MNNSQEKKNVKFHHILKKYWNYDNFRPLQLEIIKSIDKGNDSLALLTTGGGKSIIFQVAGLSKEGVCLVVTPLISLMKDQVENLQKIGIKAVAIYSGMNKKEINMAFDKCIFGNYKFLYISPERLKTELFLQKINDFKVNLIAIDEAHCISQWGYDFRPSYLKIAEIRDFLPDIPVLALTATATPKVVKDIQEKLNFSKENVFQKGFERKNLVYIVRHIEDKNNYLLKILNSSKGTAIVYVRNRKKTIEIAQFLQKNKISADFYHAGLIHKIRNQKQENWKTNKTRVIVATNAFGMGIDKPDVRVVVHLDLPDSLEAYFQEAGRAGRDEKMAYAVLLYQENDKIILEKYFKTKFVNIDFIKKVYHALCNFLQIPVGSGKEQVFDFELITFIKNFKLPSLETYNALKYLEKENYIELTESIFSPSKLMFTIKHDDLYKLQVSNKNIDKIVKILLRNYSGLFGEYVKIDENFLARRGNTEISTIKKYLFRLSEMKIMDYIPQKKNPLLILTQERISPQNFKLSAKNLKLQKDNAKNRIDAIIHYANSKQRCRSQILMFYFGQTNALPCGECDICKEKNKSVLQNQEFKKIAELIKKNLSEKPQNIKELINNLKFDEAKTWEVLRFLLDKEEIIKLENNRLSVYIK